MRFARSFLRIIIATAVGLAVVSAAASFGLRSYGDSRLQRAAGEFEARHGSLAPTSYIPVAIPDSTNGAILMTLAGARIRLAGRRSDLVAEAAITPRRDWSAETVQMVAQVTEEHRDALALLLIASSSPATDFSPTEQSAQPATTNLVLGLLSGARILAANAREQSFRHDTEAFRRSAASLGALAAALCGELELNFQMAGWTAENLLLRLAAEVIQSPRARREELLTLQDATQSSDLLGEFHRYLSWRGAMAVHEALDLGNRGTWELSHLDPPARNSFDKHALVLTRNLRTALEVEEYATAIARLLEPLPTRTRRRPGVEQLFAELDLAAGRVQTTFSSRIIVRSALELRLVDASERAAAAARMARPELPVTGERLLVTTRVDGSCLVTVRGDHEAAERIFFGRFNPTPPMQIMLPAD